MWIFQNPEIIFYHFFRIFNLDILSVVRGSEFLVGTLSPELLPQFLSNPFET